MTFHIIRNDITKVAADAIVNSANPLPIYAGAVDRSIYLAAGARKLLAEREKIGPIPVGSAAYTPAFALPAKYIIHTVGPVWVDGEHSEVEALHSCYKESLKLAENLGCKSIAFPIISSGAYRFPKDLALQAAIAEIYFFLMHHPIDIYLVVYDQDTLAFSSGMFSDIREYINERYIEDREKVAIDAAGKGDVTVSGSLVSKAAAQGTVSPAVLDRINAYREGLWESYAALRNASASNHGQMSSKGPDEIFQTEDVSFGEFLCDLIAEKGMKNSEVYRAANISKQAFSQIKNNNTKPLRPTVAGFAVALHLTENEAELLYQKAGFYLSDGASDRFDYVVRSFLRKHKYNVVENNIVLYQYGLPQLGSNRQ